MYSISDIRAVLFVQEEAISSFDSLFSCFHRTHSIGFYSKSSPIQFNLFSTRARRPENALIPSFEFESPVVNRGKDVQISPSYNALIQSLPLNVGFVRKKFTFYVLIHLCDQKPSRSYFSSLSAFPFQPGMLINVNLIM